MRLRYLAASLLADGSLAAGTTVALATGATTSAAPPAKAAVKVQNYSFVAMKATVKPGGTITWNFADPVMHTSTSTQGFWSSGSKGSGSTFAHTFGSAGVYPYLCTIHTFMKASVTVPILTSGTPKKGYHLTWASAAHPGTVDVQYRKPGSTKWVSLQKGTRATGATFNPSKAGTYAVQARTHEGAHTSSWTAPLSLKIT